MLILWGRLCIFFVNMIHNHVIRISGHLHLTITSSNSSQNNIRYHGVIIWNVAINPDSSEVFFENMLKKKGIFQGFITNTNKFKTILCQLIS